MCIYVNYFFGLSFVTFTSLLLLKSASITSCFVNLLFLIAYSFYFNENCAFSALYRFSFFIHPRLYSCCSSRDVIPTASHISFLEAPVRCMSSIRTLSSYDNFALDIAISFQIYISITLPEINVFIYN